MKLQSCGVTSCGVDRVVGVWARRMRWKGTAPVMVPLAACACETVLEGTKPAPAAPGLAIE